MNQDYRDAYYFATGANMHRTAKIDPEQFANDFVLFTKQCTIFPSVSQFYRVKFGVYDEREV